MIPSYTEFGPFSESAKTSAAAWGIINRNLRGQGYGFIDYTNPYRHRPFLALPLTVQPRIKCYKKSRQAGVSENAVTETLWSLANFQMNIVYTFPSPTQSNDFSNSRVTPALKESDETMALLKGVDNVGLKELGQGWLFMRAATNEKLAEGINVDVACFDEIDRMPGKIKIAFQESLSSSRWGWVREISTPTLPGRGVDETWQKSTQHEWMVKCSKCGEKQPLKYPDNIMAINEVPIFEKVIPPGSYTYCCSKCHQPIERWRGEWVAAHPSRDIWGFHINQLQCQWITADQVEEKKRSYRFLQLFYNYVLGETHAEGGQLLTLDLLERCFNPSLRRLASRPGPKDCIRVIAGIDWGDINYVVVIAIRPNGIPYLIGINIVPDDTEPLGSVKQIEQFIKPFEPDTIIADLGYGKDRVTYLIDKFPGRVFACTYLDDAKTVVPSFSEPSSKVTVDRTACLKSMINRIREKQMEFAIYDYQPYLHVMFRHLCNLYRLLEEDEDGKITERIDYTGDGDHLAHALGYALLGMDYHGISLPFSFDFV